VLASFIPIADINNYTEIENKLRPIQHLARRFNTSIVLTHHEGKGERNDALDGALGSTALTAVPDMVLGLKKKSNDLRTLKSYKQRSGVRFKETFYAFDPKTRAITAGLAKEEMERQEARAVNSELILEHMRTVTEPVTADQLKEVVPSKQARYDALKALVGSRDLKESGRGRKGSPVQYILAQRDEERNSDNAVSVSGPLVPIKQEPNTASRVENKSLVGERPPDLAADSVPAPACPRDEEPKPQRASKKRQTTAGIPDEVWKKILDGDDETSEAS
jgi:hypothetical protein